ncbi:hypothetical protein KC19_7G031900 [Ceratodon purpureus]|uniref:Pectinesterase n=1 Tax=Ceratodon purpureus TaxID=3225 RepID=A0A8T0H765_CERPU|nr:hypothetical protein KC19_7G031900 [Ceratodon purpureus]
MGKCCCLVFIAIVALVVGGVSIGVPLALNAVKEKVNDLLGDGAVNNACQATSYPATCNQTLAGGNYTADTGGVTRHSLRMAESGVNATLESVLHLNSTNPNVTAAADVCVEALSLCKDELEAASATLLSSDLAARRQALDDLKAWVSAALELHTTCIDAVLEVSPSDRVHLQQVSTHTDQLLSNALAFINALAAYGDDLLAWRPTGFSLPDGMDLSHLPKIPGLRNRRLLSHPTTPDDRHSLPDWVSETDSPPRWMDSQTQRRLLTMPPTSYDVVVAKDGSGNYTTIQDAVDAHSENFVRLTIYIKAGVYNEQVIVPKTAKFLTFIGDGDRTVITGSRNVALMAGMTTYRSATLIVSGRGFIGRSFKVENTAGALGHQAVAFRGTADKIAMYQVTFDGYQDTLYAHSYRQYYRECTISGTVDFIFGNAAASFQSCKIIAKQTTLLGQRNTYSAQGRTDAHQSTGLSFQNCLFDATPEVKSNTTFYKTYLGRPWKAYSVCVIMKSELMDHIDSTGWLPWNTTDFGLHTSFFGEYHNYGPGSSYNSSRVPWSHQISSGSTADEYQAINFIRARKWVTGYDIPLTESL